MVFRHTAGAFRLAVLTLMLLGISASKSAQAQDIQGTGILLLPFSWAQVSIGPNVLQYVQPREGRIWQSRGDVSVTRDETGTTLTANGYLATRKSARSWEVTPVLIEAHLSGVSTFGEIRYTLTDESGAVLDTLNLTPFLWSNFVGL